MSLLAHIKIDPAICDGLPSVGRYSVAQLVSLLQAGHEYEEILAHYEDLWPDDLLAAEGYAAAVQYQNSITLRELVEQARPCFREQTGYDLEPAWVYEDLCTNSPLNLQLKKWRRQGVQYVTLRDTPLAPDVPVFGQFLSLQWLSHDGFFWLANYISRDEMTSEVSGLAGVFNGYIACLAPFESGKFLPYRAHYTDLQGARKVLDKLHEERYPEGWDGDFDLYRDVKIEWLR